MTLGLCTQIELDALVQKWSAKKEKLLAEARIGLDDAPAQRAGAIGSGVSVDYSDEATASEDDDYGYAASESVDVNSVFGPSSALADDVTDEDDEA